MSESAHKIERLGRYQVQGVIGRGAMGVVYQAVDPVIGRTVAVKTMAFPEGLPASAREESFQRFAREARAAGALSHPGIVTIHDAGRDPATGLSFIAMEYVRGGTLQELVRRAGPLAQPRAVEILRRLAEALAYAHERGVVHRDLKPANVLIAEDGTVKVTDFGVARLESSELTREGQAIGSPAYMSPEQIRGAAADRRSDLFSLGVIGFEMLAGRRPFEAADLSAVAYQIVHAPAPALDALRPDLDAGLTRVIARLLAKAPEDRYPAAAALLADLEPPVAWRVPAAAGAGDGAATEVDPGQGAPGAAPAVPHPPREPGGLPGAMARLRHAGRRAWKASVPVLRTAAAALRVLGLRAAAALRGLLPPSRRGGRLERYLPHAVLGTALALGLLWLAMGIGTTRVAVAFDHGLAGGRLRIEVDGDEVLDRRFKGKKPPGRGVASKVFRQRSGSLQGSFRVRPGEHEVRVEVTDREGRQWVESDHTTIPANAETRLAISAATGFTRGVAMDWQFR